MKIGLRPYQERAVEKVDKAYKDGKNTALIVLPTGLGKTCCMAAVAEEEVKEGGRVLFLAHRTTLLKQAAEEIEHMTGIETGYISGKKNPATDIVLSSIQGMSRDDRLNMYDPDEFSMVMVDEAHHITAGSYEKIIDHFENAKLLGVTATPKRGDDKDISDKFKEVASEYTLCEAIDDKWLSPIVLQNCPVKIDISNTHVMAGDYSARDIGDALLPYMEDIADQIIEKASDRKTLIFVPLVATARGMAEIFKRKGVNADYVAGERKDSEEVMEKFKKGEINVLINSMLLTEGYNEPSVNCIVNLRVTKSEALLRQIIGRGTRLALGKDNLLILDFIWKNRRGRKSLSISDIIAMELGIDEKDYEEVIRRCKKYGGDPLDVMSLVRDMGGCVKEEREAALLRALKRAKEERSIKERIRSGDPDAGLLWDLRNDLNNTIRFLMSENRAIQISEHVYYIKYGGSRYYYTNIPIFKALEIDLFESIRRWDKEEPTEKQELCLKNFGLDPEFVPEENRDVCFINRGYSNYIISTLMDRKNKGLCSYKQAKLLYKKGIRDFSKIRFKTASKAIDLLAKNRWIPERSFYDLIDDEVNRQDAIMVV